MVNVSQIRDMNFQVKFKDDLSESLWPYYSALPTSIYFSKVEIFNQFVIIVSPLNSVKTASSSSKTDLCSFFDRLFFIEDLFFKYYRREIQN